MSLLAACPCGARGKEIDRWPRYNSRHYFYEIVTASGNVSHTVEVRWSHDEGRYVTSHIDPTSEDS